MRHTRLAVSLSLVSVSVFVRCLPVSQDAGSSEHLIDISRFGEKAFQSPSERTGARVSAWTVGSGVNPEELGEYAEGDILFPRDFEGRNGLIAATSHWKDGVVPYEITGNFASKELELIQTAFGIYHSYTCIKFRLRQATDADYVVIESNKTGCWSSVGKLGGPQTVNLDSPGCVTQVGTVVHELMHSLGFFHEQSRVDRDDYVDIAWQNVPSDNVFDFQKANKSKVEDFGVGYDYGSIMHYTSTAFGINGSKTIIPKYPEAEVIMGQRYGMSKSDLTKINRMYKCDLTTIAKPLPIVNTAEGIIFKMINLLRSIN